MVIIALFIASMIAPSAFAKEGKRVAFVVGINTYDNFGKDKHLERAVSDARAISQTLKALGYEVIEGIDVTLSDFDKKWQAAVEKTTPEDTLLFFFSGHGVEIDGENFLLPRDVPFFAFGRDKQFKRRAVSVTELLADLKTGDRKSPKVTVVILDACRDNPTIPSQYKTKSMLPQGGLAKVPKTRGTFMLYAAEPGKLSLDRLGPDDTDPNSVFTRSLLPLVGQANLSIQSLAIQVKEKVHALTESDEQLPEYTDGLIGQFCLAGCAISTREDTRPAAPAGTQQNRMPDAAPVQSVSLQPKLDPKGILDGLGLGLPQTQPRRPAKFATPSFSGAMKTESGIVITTIKPGTGATPKATDTVKVHYHGTLTDGTVFDSSIKRGEPALFPLDKVIKCWTEAVQQIKVGGKSRFVCPPNLAYGDAGSSVIKPGSTLIFEVELLEIVAAK